MNTIIFNLEFIERTQNNVKTIFDFNNPFTNCRMSRVLFFTLTDKKGELYKEHLKPYIEFLISHKMLTESMLTLAQDKLLSYILFKYPKSYPHTKKGMPPGISRYFKRQNYDRFCLNKESEKTLSKNLNTSFYSSLGTTNNFPDPFRPGFSPFSTFKPANILFFC